jgi:FIMAH domain-containing protein
MPVGKVEMPLSEGDSTMRRLHRSSPHLLVVPFVATVAILAIAALHAPAASAHASFQVTDTCAQDMTTITSLQMCVRHAAQMGAIDNQGVTNSLLAKLNAAQAAADRGQFEVAVNGLQAFSQEVRAQRGQHIDAEHADHMLMHAEMVIMALSSS